MNENNEIGFAVVGLGMGSSRADLVRETPGAKLAWVIDTNQDRAAEIGGRLECRWSTDLDDALADEAVNVVHTMTPSGLHGEICIRAMEAGKHAITTKPMEVSLDRCDAMIAAQERTGRLLCVDFELRYHDVNQQIKYGLNHGLFGKPILCEARLKWYRSQSYYEASGWRGTWAMDGGGSLANQSIHLLDLMGWFMGRPRRVTGKIGVFNHDIETEDLGMAMVEFESGAVGMILGTTTFPGDHVSGIELHGSEGGVIATRAEPEWLFREPQADRREQLQRADPRKNVVEDMLQALRGGTPTMCDGQGGRRSIELLNAVYASAQNGGTPVEM